MSVRCQALLGNRYGYRPIPSVINADEFNCLKSAAGTSLNNDWALVGHLLTSLSLIFCAIKVIKV